MKHEEGEIACLNVIISIFDFTIIEIDLVSEVHVCKTHGYTKVVRVNWSLLIYNCMTIHSRFQLARFDVWKG